MEAQDTTQGAGRKIAPMNLERVHVPRLRKIAVELQVPDTVHEGLVNGVDRPSKKAGTLPFLGHEAGTDDHNKYIVDKRSQRYNGC